MPALVNGNPGLRGKHCSSDDRLIRNNRILPVFCPTSQMAMRSSGRFLLLRFSNPL